MKGSDYRIIRRSAKGFIKLFYISAAATIIKVAASFAVPQVIRFAVDHVIDNVPLNYPRQIINMLDAIGGIESLKENLWLFALLILILAVITGISDYMGRITLARGTEGTIKALRDKLFEHIQNLPYSWHIKNQTGDIIQRSTSDVEVIRNFISTQLVEMFRVIILVIISLILMFLMNFQLTVAVLIFIPLVLLYSTIFYGILAKKFLVADEAEGQLFTTIQENLTGVRVVRAFGRERHEIEKFSERNNTFSELWVKLGYQLGYYWGIGDLVTGVLLMVIVVYGTYFAINDVITLGEFLAFASYAAMIGWPLRSFGRILSELSKAKVSLKRICEILSEPVEFDDPDSLTPDIFKDIEFKNVSFKYEGEISVLKNISFKIKAGSTFAILGGTGSGKTTLMYLLNRLYDLPDDMGSITIGGVNIKNIKREHLRKNIGMVLQEPFLFSRTIKENIAIVNPDTSMDEIKGAASIARVDESIEEFSKGYDTLVGERGVTLSGGQKQRVAIARMLLQKTPIMVFDDSLSAVDADTDAKIRSSLKKRKGSSTIIIISHRITTLMESDTILVLDKGQVSDIGTHEELINRDGIYKDIYNVQMNLAEEDIE
ncbi:MAG: ABC transporter ATP-binding protein [Tissierellia bacterium]|nr:ABC transporter ATP-binding protein [Tissierellia bacterium]